MTPPAIRTRDLRRTYALPKRQRKPDGPDVLTALDGANLEVQRGELFGLLGPNGAGKTTLIKILTTLLAPTSGQAEVDGFDVVTQAQDIRQRINMVSGGESCGYGILTVRENLWLFSQLYGIPRAEALKRIDEMLTVVGMTDRAHSKISHLSTGLRQKMNFCRGFITDPSILFLDEPTLGLDVHAARAIRQFIESWLTTYPDRTILLTTHYMQEADDLCDRVAIIDRGKVLACDTPDALKRKVQQYPIFEIAISPGADGWQKLGELPGVHQSTSSSNPTSVDVKVVLQEEAVIGNVVQHLVQSGSRILTMKKVEPTLEDVFVELVGHGLEEQQTEAAR